MLIGWCSLNRILKGQQLSKHPGLWDTCEEMFSSHIQSPLLLGVLVDIYQEHGDHTHLDKALEVNLLHHVHPLIALIAAL